MCTVTVCCFYSIACIS